MLTPFNSGLSSHVSAHNFSLVPVSVIPGLSSWAFGSSLLASEAEVVVSESMSVSFRSVSLWCSFLSPSHINSEFWPAETSNSFECFFT